MVEEINKQVFVQNTDRCMTVSARRVTELYNEGGLTSVLVGVRREINWRRSRAAVWALKKTNHPNEALKRYLRIRRLLQPNRYTDAEPFKIVWVGPDDIEHYSTDPPYYWGRVSGGNWERVEFTEHPVYRALKKRFVEGRTWEEALSKTGLRGNSNTEPKRIDRLHATIAKDGYKTQEEILSENSDEARKRNNDTAHPLMNEIGVCIDQNGEFIWRHVGQHRLCIAKILGIDELPVQVRSRHRDWQDIRDEIRRAEHKDELSERANAFLSHPDLRDIARDL